MGAYAGLNAYYNGALCDYAIKYGYDESVISILKGELGLLQKKYSEIYNNAVSCGHHSDRRTPLQYAQDLVASWVFEDYFLRKMQDAEFQIELSGADRRREILPNQKTSTSSDYLITSSSGRQINMELVNDYTGFWAKNHKLHLRDNKYLHLQKSGSLLLAIALTPYTKKYALFDFRQEIPAYYIASHRPYGYKPAYELEIPLSAMHDFTIDNVTKHISELIL